MRNLSFARRRRATSALLQFACFAQVGFAAVALTGVAHGAPAMAERVGMVFEDLDRRCTDCERAHVPTSAAASTTESVSASTGASVTASAGASTGVDAVVPNRLGLNQHESVDPMSPLPGALVVSADLLEAMRGGYELSDRGNTLRVTFGVERAVYVNGALVSTSTLGLDGLGRLVSSGVVAQDTQVRGLGLTADSLRVGAGNVLSMNPTELPTGALVLQNTLNDQRLEARTMVNAVVEGAHLMRAARLESIMRDSSIGAVRR